MPEETLDVEAITDLAEKAQVIAEATNRRQEDVLADLLDDGIANMSAGADAEKGDFLDKAQEQAEKLKGLLTTLIPIILLLGGVGAEGLGVLDVTGWGSDSMWEDDEGPNQPPNTVRWGCTAKDAANYNSNANEDDGSCYWDNQPPCNPQWYYDEYGFVEETNLEVRFAFQDNAGCNIEHFGGHFIITLFESGEQQEQAFLRNIDFVNGISMEYTFEDLAEGTYHYRVEFHVVECEDGSCEHGDEYYLPSTQQFTIEPQEEPEGCDAYLINPQAYLLEEDDEQDAVRISADVDLVDQEENCDDEQFEITWRLYQDGEVAYEQKTFEDGQVSDPDGADYTYHTWDGVAVGTYEPKIILRLDGEVLDEKVLASSISIETQPIYGCTDYDATNYDSMATDDDGSCEYPPEEPCEVEIQNHYRGHVAEDEEQDAIVVAFKLVPENCEGENIFVEIDLFQNGYAANYSWDTTVMGDSPTDISHIFDGVAIGNSWIPMITVTHEGNQLAQVNFWGIDVVAPEPEVCEINLYDIALQTNATHATVAFDLDCGETENDLDGYNVSVQFLIYPVNETSQENIVVYDTCLHYIQGYIDDTHTITLTNFSDNNTTHYDIYWYAIWTDHNGDQKMIEQKWLNREMNP